MENWVELSKNIVKIIFIVVVPTFVVYMRVKKKIATSFALGAIMVSFIVALIGVASIYEDPKNIFINEINSGNYEESKRLYKIIVQGGPEKIAEVNEEKIIYKEHLKRIRQELVEEYEEIAERYYRTITVVESEDCGDFIAQEKNLKNLKHAIKLLNYSASIGGGNPVLYDRLIMKIENGERIIKRMEERC